MRLARVVPLLGLCLLAISLILWAWLFVGRVRSSTNRTFGPTEPTWLAAWQLDLNAPRLIALGESGRATLRVSSIHAPIGSVAFADYDVFLEAEAEIPGAVVSPSGRSSQAFSSGSAAVFDWKVWPQSEGLLEGRIWLYVRLVKRDGSETLIRPITLQPVTMTGVTLFGRTASRVRPAALICFWAGLALVIIPLILRFRRRKFRDL
jgi:hypothetical protein